MLVYMLWANSSFYHFLSDRDGLMLLRHEVEGQLGSVWKFSSVLCEQHFSLNFSMAMSRVGNYSPVILELLHNIGRSGLRDIRFFGLVAFMLIKRGCYFVFNPRHSLLLLLFHV